MQLPTDWEAVEAANATEVEMTQIRRNPALNNIFSSIGAIPNAPTIPVAAMDPADTSAFPFAFFCLKVSIPASEQNPGKLGDVVAGMKAQIQTNPANRIVAEDKVNINGREFVRITIDQTSEKARSWSYLTLDGLDSYTFMFAADSSRVTEFGQKVEAVMNTVTF